MNYRIDYMDSSKDNFLAYSVYSEDGHTVKTLIGVYYDGTIQWCERSSVLPYDDCSNYGYESFITTAELDEWLDDACGYRLPEHYYENSKPVLEDVA